VAPREGVDVGVREAPLERLAVGEGGGAASGVPLAGGKGEGEGEAGVPALGVGEGVAVGEAVGEGEDEDVGDAVTLSANTADGVSDGDAKAVGVAVGEPVAVAVGVAEEGVAKGVSEGVTDTSAAGDGDACASPATRLRVFAPLSARKRSQPTITLPMGALSVAAVPMPLAEPADPLPTSVVTASVVRLMHLSALLEESLTRSPKGLRVTCRGLKNAAEVPTPSVKPFFFKVPASVETIPAGLMRRTR